MTVSLQLGPLVGLWGTGTPRNARRPPARDSCRSCSTSGTAKVKTLFWPKLLCVLTAAHTCQPQPARGRRRSEAQRCARHAHAHATRSGNACNASGAVVAWGSLWACAPRRSPSRRSRAAHRARPHPSAPPYAPRRPHVAECVTIIIISTRAAPPRPRAQLLR